jgi:hypothetical protein
LNVPVNWYVPAANFVVSLNPTAIVIGLPPEIDPLEGEKVSDPVGSEVFHEYCALTVERVTFWLGGVGLPAVTEKVRLFGATERPCPWHRAARKIPHRIPSAARNARDRFLFI